MTLAAMISSPSFNPVVVAMAFVLFPLQLALWRIAVPVALLASAAAAHGGKQAEGPELRYVQRRTGRRTGSEADRRSCEALWTESSSARSWMTLPWMLLSGRFWEQTMAVVTIPAYGTNLPVTVHWRSDRCCDCRYAVAGADGARCGTGIRALPGRSSVTPTQWHCCVRWGP